MFINRHPANVSTFFIDNALYKNRKMDCPTKLEINDEESESNHFQKHTKTQCSVS